MHECLKIHISINSKNLNTITIAFIIIFDQNPQKSEKIIRQAERDYIVNKYKSRLNIVKESGTYHQLKVK